MYCFISTIYDMHFRVLNKYDLMLCFVAWTIYFLSRGCFNRTLNNKSKFKYILVLFFISLDVVYRWYGAVFIVSVLVVFLFGDLCLKRNKFVY